MKHKIYFAVAGGYHALLGGVHAGYLVSVFNDRGRDANFSKWEKLLIARHGSKMDYHKNRLDNVLRYCECDFTAEDTFNEWLSQQIKD